MTRNRAFHRTNFSPSSLDMPFASIGRLAAVLTLSLVASSAVGAEPGIVAKARAYLGSESALNGVKSVHYVGTMEAPNAADPAKPTLVTIDIIFQAPYSQRTVRSTPTLVDTTALDDYDSWHRVHDPKDPSRWNLQVLPASQIKRQRAIVWENLAFFRGLEREGGKLVDQGRVTLGGVACRKLAFVHDTDVVFIRYFDESSGRLMLTETEGGSSIREQGEIMAGGIRFPKMILNSLKGPDGKEQMVTITFDRITVNEGFPRSTFAMPTFTGK